MARRAKTVPWASTKPRVYCGKYTSTESTAPPSDILAPEDRQGRLGCGERGGSPPGLAERQLRDAVDQIHEEAPRLPIPPHLNPPRVVAHHEDWAAWAHVGRRVGQRSGQCPRVRFAEATPASTVRGEGPGGGSSVAEDSAR